MCTRSCSSSSSPWCCCGVFVGSICNLPTPKQAADARHCTVSFGLAAQTIARSVDMPPRPRWGQDQDLLQYVPGARTAPRTRWQANGATLSTAHSRHGSRQNPSTMDDARGALVSFASSLRLRGIEARWGGVSCRGQMGGGTSRRAWVESHSREEKACWDCPLMKIPAQRGCTEATRIIHHLEWEHPPSCVKASSCARTHYYARCSRLD
jgi:hypothetical protein